MNLDPSLRRKIRNLTPIAAAFTLAAAGCGSSHTANAAPSSAPATPRHEVRFKFDSLGSKVSKGGSNVIRVFRGYKSDDKETSGTFLSGQSTLATCKVVGRMVHSVPSEGEAPRHSDEWLKLDDPGISGNAYATEVYTEPSEAHELSKLPEC